MTSKMRPGDKLVCANASGYMLTLGRVYTVVGYEPSYRDAESAFTWDDYVSVTDDEGRVVKCHPHRFKPLGDTK